MFNTYVYYSVNPEMMSISDSRQFEVASAHLFFENLQQHHQSNSNLGESWKTKGTNHVILKALFSSS